MGDETLVHANEGGDYTLCNVKGAAAVAASLPVIEFKAAFRSKRCTRCLDKIVRRTREGLRR